MRGAGAVELDESGAQREAERKLLGLFAFSAADICIGPCMVGVAASRGSARDRTSLPGLAMGRG